MILVYNKNKPSHLLSFFGCAKARACFKGVCMPQTMRIFTLLVCLIVPMCSKAIELISHRGNTCGAPENTLEEVSKNLGH